MTVTYQPVLVLLSIGVAILGSLTALALTSGSDDAEGDSWLTSFALANGGLIMGGTIWSMHFIAMMAVDFPILVNFFATPTRDRTFGLQIRQAALLAKEAHALQP